MKSLPILASLAILVMGCDSQSELIVNLRTDLAPRFEFDSVRIELAGEAAAGGRVDVRSVSAGEDYVEGVTIATFDGLGDGNATLITALRDADGRVVLERVTRVQISGSTAVTVLVTRDCRGVTCPGSGDAALTSCHAARCVDDACSGEMTDACGDSECGADAECPAAAPCSVPRCIDGTCYYARRDEECAADEWCNVDDGCLPIGPVADGGPPDAGDAGDAGSDGGCAGSTFDCDGDPVNGCEVDLMTSELHCGACDRPCMGADICEDGMCSQGPVIDVSAGTSHACALHQAGSVACWGEGRQGQLGDGMGRISDLPVRVSDLEDIVSISAGHVHTCAVDGAGTLFCWGDNTFGQLADATMTSSNTPVEGGMGVGAYSAVSAGVDHTCAILGSDGTVWCYGLNDRAQLGYGGAGTGSEPPVRDFDISPQPQRDFVEVTVARKYSCALRRNEGFYCWGGCSGCTGRFSSIGQVRTMVRQGDAGDAHRCVVNLDGTVQCHGNGTSGELGRGDTTSSTEWMNVILEGGGDVAGARHVAAGVNHTCVALMSGDLLCWGSGIDGARGDGTEDQATAAVAVPTLPGVTRVRAGDGFTCALTDTAQVHCWGRNDVGQVGDGTRTNRLAPVMVYE